MGGDRDVVAAAVVDSKAEAGVAVRVVVGGAGCAGGVWCHSKSIALKSSKGRNTRTKVMNMPTVIPAIKHSVIVCIPI